jgi:hypothetical protein
MLLCRRDRSYNERIRFHSCPIHVVILTQCLNEEKTVWGIWGVWAGGGGCKTLEFDINK